MNILNVIQVSKYNNTDLIINDISYSNNCGGYKMMILFSIIVTISEFLFIILPTNNPININYNNVIDTNMLF